MMYFANPRGEGTLPAMLAGLLGYIDAPLSKQGVRPDGVVWCADNSCFGDAYPGDEKWFEWLTAQTADAATCAFATAPDVVGDAVTTLARSAPWLPKIRALGFPPAFVAQNGQTEATVPWADLAVLFIGGTKECLRCSYVRPTDDTKRDRCPHCQHWLTEWKEDVAARRLVRAGLARGKWVHMGRVNSGKRYRMAQAIGCDSVDGTYLTFGPDTNLPKLLGWVRSGQHDTLFAITE